MYINIDEDGNPTDFDLEKILNVKIIIMGIMIFLLNVSTYIKVANQSRQVYRYMREVSEEMAKNVIEREKQIGKLLSIMSVLFFVVFCPHAILRKIDADARSTMPGASMVCFLISWSYGIIDPLCYIIFQEKCRNAINDLFKQLYICCQSS